MTMSVQAMILVLLMCIAIAAVFCVVFTVLISIVVAALLERKRALEMDVEYDELADSREVFWGTLHPAYGRFRESNPEAPEQLEDLILADGLPPGFEPRKIANMTQWLKENADDLDQNILWKFSSSIYPDRQNSIEPTYAESFHQARRRLALFWNKWVPLNEWLYFLVYFRPMQYLWKHYASADNQLIMLTWLELALIRRVADHGRKDMAIFRIAVKFAKKKRRPR